MNKVSGKCFKTFIDQIDYTAPFLFINFDCFRKFKSLIKSPWKFELTRPKSIPKQRLKRVKKMNLTILRREEKENNTTKTRTKKTSEKENIQRKSLKEK